MQEKHPGDGYTVFITLWQDNSFRAECRSGKPLVDKNIIRSFIYEDNNIIYRKSEVVDHKHYLVLEEEKIL